MDMQQSLQEAVLTACAERSSLALTGTGSKVPWLGVAGDYGRAQSLALADYTGVVDYQPAELVVTAKAGTRLRDLNLELAQKNQEIAAEPPLLQGEGTLGGAVAAGFSGPARPWLGSLRDAVLGVKILNGRGELLNFGGQVMKNVAGYDIARLMTGSMGSLGALLEVSIRVRPKAEHELTLAYEVDAQAGVELCRSMATQPLPLTGTFWNEDRLLVRFAGAEAGLRSAQRKLGGEVFDVGDLWRLVRDHQLAFFKSAAPGRAVRQTAVEEGENALFCIHTPPGAPLPEQLDDQLAIEWGGGRRWLWHQDVTAISNYASSVGGWMWQVGSVVGLGAMEKQLMQRIKQSFDPHGIFASPTELERSYAD